MASLSKRWEEEIRVITGKKGRASARISSFSKQINQNYIRSSRVSNYVSSVGKTTDPN